jgi:hypothetical protein
MSVGDDMDSGPPSALTYDKFIISINVSGRTEESALLKLHPKYQSLKETVRLVLP